MNYSTTTSMMKYPRAGEIYADIPATTPPDTLADLFCQLIAHSDATSQVYALAIEAHMRTLAQYHFQLTAVRAALARIEKALDFSTKNAQGRKSTRKVARERILAQHYDGVPYPARFDL